MNTGYSLELRNCMREIEDVMKRYDCGGFIALSNRSHAEFKMCIDTPTWSNVRFLREGKAVHIKLYAKSDHANTEATVGMLANIRDLSALAFQQSEELMKRIEEQVKVEHVPFGGGINNDDR